MNSYYLEIANKIIHKEFEHREIFGFPLTTVTYSAAEFESKPYETKPFEVLSHDTEYKGAESLIKDEVSSNPIDEISDAEFSRTYTSFSGCDMVISFDDKIYGEIQGLDFFKVYPMMAAAIAQNSDYIDRHMVTEYPVVLVINTSLFNKSVEIKDGSNITITYANEYGQKAMRSIFDVHVVCASSGMSIDQVMNEELFILCAKDVTGMVEPKEGSINEDRTTEGTLI